MTTATAHDKLRQIAILVSSVDAAAARQLLLHLPTDKAKQVRAMASQLGVISAEEKRRILADFQRSAARPSPSPSRRPPHSLDVGLQAANLTDHDDKTRGPSEHLDYASLDQGTASNASRQSSEEAGWARLNTQTLVRFVQGERSAVTAVVISQLAPHTAVEVLQQLPPNVSHDVLQRLARLQDIDPEAMAAIDEYLAQRLGEHEHRLEGELENARRMNALLAAAPEALRLQWSQVLNHSAEATGNTAPKASAENTLAATATPEISGAELANVQQSRTPMSTPVSAEDLDRSSHTSSDVRQTPSAERTEENHVLPFANHNQQQPVSEVDRSLIQLEFESLLELPSHSLAKLLSAAESETVLLALAGATPHFMQRFYDRLNRPDAAALQNRLQKLGVIQLRDVDEAQRRIVELSSRLGLVPTSSTELRNSARAA